MNLAGLRLRLARAAGAIPRNPPEPGTTTEAVDLALAAGLVLVELERWASARPGFVAMPEPTVLHHPSVADLRMVQNCPQLAELAEAHLTHSADAIAARLALLLEQYRAAGQPDEAIEATLADVRARLAALEETGANIPE
ncbi:MAG: hypothetical protein WCG85_18235, partial [Polyangia bacterium]